MVYDAMDDAPPPYPDEDPFGPPPPSDRSPQDGGGRSFQDNGGRPFQDNGGRRSASRVPPHNITVEESLLGAMLLSKDAIADAIEIVETADFYKPAHQHVFEAITSLYSVGEPADTVTVSAELERAGLLQGIGGGGALVSYLTSTPAATNATKYAKIVHELALLRRLIHVGTDIAEVGYSQPDDVVKAIDSAETMVFNLSQGRAADTLAPIRDLLDDNLDRLEQLYEQGDAITGTPTGFVDLDELLSGLQPNALVVIGARPAMGKTAFGLNLVAHAAMQAQRPVLFFSLEMGQLEISQRLLCAEARVDSTRVRNGNLTEDDWSNQPRRGASGRGAGLDRRQPAGHRHGDPGEGSPAQEPCGRPGPRCRRLPPAHDRPQRGRESPDRGGRDQPWTQDPGP